MAVDMQTRLQSVKYLLHSFTLNPEVVFKVSLPNPRLKDWRHPYGVVGQPDVNQPVLHSPLNIVFRHHLFNPIGSVEGAATAINRNSAAHEPETHSINITDRPARNMLEVAVNISDPPIAAIAPNCAREIVVAVDNPKRNLKGLSDLLDFVVEPLTFCLRVLRPKTEVAKRDSKIAFSGDCRF